MIPDILKGDPIVSFDELQAWLPKHTPEITAPIVNGFLKSQGRVKANILGQYWLLLRCKIRYPEFILFRILDAGAVASIVCLY